VLLLLSSLIACQESRVPEDSIYYDVTVTGETDGCHPDATDGYQSDFSYALSFDASSATIYIGEDVFAVGSITGCDLTYQTVVIGQDTESDGEVKWQLFGTASVDPAEGDACVEGDTDWEGTEYFEIVESADESLEVGCQYTMSTVGNLVASGG
jgi:hypothetical protein